MKSHKNIPTSDAQLISEILNGDASKFAEIVERYKDMVAGIVMNMIADPDVANDVGQEVFIRLFRSLKKFRADSSLGTYIGRIAINLSLNELKRKQKVNERFVAGYDEVVERKSAGTMSSLEAKDALELALRELPEDQKTVIILRHIEGFSTKEASEILNLPQGTVLSRLSRGMEKMKKVLEKMGFNLH